MKKKIINLAILLLIGSICFAIDFTSKLMVLEAFGNSEKTSFKIIGILNIILTYNHGISFGMLNNAIYEQWMFMGLTSAIVFVLTIWLLFAESKLMVAAISMIIGGALGNIYDRYAYGAVVDFIDFHIGLWHYPAFNMADSFIVLGVLALLFLTSPRKSEIGKFA